MCRHPLTFCNEKTGGNWCAAADKGPAKEPYSEMAHKGMGRHKSLFSGKQSVFPPLSLTTEEGFRCQEMIFFNSGLYFFKKKVLIWFLSRKFLHG